MKPEILTLKNFSPFGDVIEPNEQGSHYRINEGYTERYHDLAQLDLNQNQGRPLVNIFRSTPKALPITIETMESHPLSSQAFIPLSHQPYLVVVAPKGDFQESKIKVFLASPTQGVNYHRGVWHHYSLALNEVSDFVVIDRGGEGENCNEVALQKPLEISL